MTKPYQQLRFPWLPYLFADVLAVVLAYYVTFFWRFRIAWGQQFYDWVAYVLLNQSAGETDETLELFYYTSAFRIILLLSAVLLTLYALRNLYAGRRFILRFPVAWNVLVCNLIALAIFYGYWYLTRNVFHPRSLFATVIVLNIILCPFLRFLMRKVLGFIRKKWGIDRYAALIVGDGEAADLLQEYLDTMEPHGIYCAHRQMGIKKQLFADWLTSMRQSISQHRIDMLIVADDQLTVAQIMQVIELTAEAGISLKVWSDHFEVLIAEADLPCDMLFGTPLVHFEALRDAKHEQVLRHGLTLVCSFLLLLLTLPLMAILVVVIRMTSSGPAIFKQKRIGINRKPFYIYKFRTMHEMAEEALATIESDNESEGALFKIRRDPRITRVGRFLRRFSLDELPQLFNIIRGEMAIVGPRPLPERDFEKYEEDWHYIRHGGLPGLTCLWQISGRSDLDFHQMCILDIYYLRNHNLILDLQILLQTIRTVLFGIGAY